MRRLLGLAVGYSFINYVTNVFAPVLLSELRWSKSDFGFLGLIVFAAVICQPVAGRLADVVGVRRVAILGVLGNPLLFVTLSLMEGAFWQFCVISVLQVVIVGATSGPAIYTRVVAELFIKRRGTALGIASCAPAVARVLSAPLLAGLVASQGWRTGYVAVGVFVALTGLVALPLIPSTNSKPRRQATIVPEHTAHYKTLFRNRTFLIIATGIVMCNITLTLQLSQIGLLLGERGVSLTKASFMISLYAAGIIAGRLLCGAALDHFPAYIVSALTMTAPALGLLLLASGINFGSLAAVVGGLLFLLKNARMQSELQ